MATRKYRGQFATYDSLKFVIDEISPGGPGEMSSVVGHYVMMKNDKDAYTLPRTRLILNQAALLNAVKIKTKYHVNYR